MRSETMKGEKMEAKMLNQVGKHIENLQWDLDRMSQGGRDEYSRLVKIWNKLINKKRKEGKR